jgi:hypothetical protein
MARLRARLITDRRSAPWLLLPMLVVALAGCSVRFIQPYDEVIEKTVTDSTRSSCASRPRSGGREGPARTIAASTMSGSPS